MRFKMPLVYTYIHTKFLTLALSSVRYVRNINFRAIQYDGLCGCSSLWSKMKIYCRHHTGEHTHKLGICANKVRNKNMLLPKKHSSDNQHLILFKIEQDNVNTLVGKVYSNVASGICKEVVWDLSCFRIMSITDITDADA